MYTVEVRDRMMIAHSLPHAIFGPAQGLHGATFVVDVAFTRLSLSEQNIVVDIGLAIDILKRVLLPLNYQNLDEIPEFEGKLTTTEFLAKHIFDQFIVAIGNDKLGVDGKALHKICVTLHETDLARGSFEGKIAEWLR